MFWGYKLQSAISPTRFCRILLDSAMLDNLHIETLMNAAHCERVALAAGQMEMDPMALVAKLCMTEKLWSVDNGRKLTKIVCALQSDFTFRNHTNEELVFQLDAAMNSDKKFADVIRITVEIMARSSKGRTMAYDRALDRVRERAEGNPAESLFDLLDERRGRRSAAEQRLFVVAVTWLIGGVWGQDLIGDAEALLFRDYEARTFPTWSSPNDKRFDPSWDGYSNMAQMLDQYGAVRPEDQGVLFRTLDGVWSPIIKEERGVYLVQSQRFPRKFYEVNIAKMSCDCEGYMHRQTPCKHVDVAKAHFEATLPFSVA